MTAAPGRIVVGIADYMVREPFLKGSQMTIDYFHRRLSFSDISGDGSRAVVRTVHISPADFEELLSIGTFEDYRKYTMMDDQTREALYGSLTVPSENDGYTVVEVTDASLMTTISQRVSGAHVNSPYNLMLKWIYEHEKQSEVSV